MAKATQKGRILSIQTQMGEDYFLLNKVTGTEGISQLYSFDIEILHDSPKQSKTAYIPNINSVLGQAATISLTQRDGGSRFFNGIFNFFKLTGRTPDYSFYNATLVPQVWELTQVFQSRIFQQKSVPEILKEIFKGYQTRFELSWEYKPRNYCVQYAETDFDFASRLMEEEGICYYFEFSSTKETLVITDNFQQPRDLPNKSNLPIFDEQLDESVGEESAIRSWFVEYKVQPGKITLWDYHFQMPKKQLDAQQISRHDVAGNRELEIYRFPGGYARKYDGISKDGGEQPGDLQNMFDDNQQSAKDQIEIWDSDYISYYGDSDCGTMMPGHRFNLKNHPHKEYNSAYIVTTVKHEINQQPNFLVEVETDEAYRNSFTCIPHGSGKPEYRPHVRTAKPKIFGTQTAFVVGPPGEEIFTDKYGRVKVQFHWDRHGKTNSESSCWVRVAQSLAGNKWGAMFIPRVGMEVLVHFVEGDPDQPIITGCLYNPDSMPPYNLPAEKTKSTLKTNSSKGGGGFNELRIEDKKGEEQIFLHGEKNLDVRIKNDAKATIKRDKHLIVERDHFEKVKRDKTLKVQGDQAEDIGGSFSKSVGMSIQEKANQKIAFDAGTEIHLKAGMNATIEAGVSLTLKVGGNFVNINPGGVFISGTMVMVNSGGAAGSGSGCSPTPPKEPLEADTADPGDRIPAPKPPPPTPPRKQSPRSAAMKKAAKEGTPFVAANPSESKDERLKKAISKLGKDAERAVEKIGKKAAAKIVEKGADVKAKADEVKRELEIGIKKVKDSLNEGIVELTSVADQGKKALDEALSEIKEKLKKIEEGFDKGKEALEKAEKVVEKAEEAIGKAEEIKQKLTEAKEKAAEVKKAVEEKADEVKKAFEEKKKEVSKILDGLG